MVNIVVLTAKVTKFTRIAAIEAIYFGLFNI